MHRIKNDLKCQKRFKILKKGVPLFRSLLLSELSQGQSSESNVFVISNASNMYSWNSLVDVSSMVNIVGLYAHVQAGLSNWCRVMVEVEFLRHGTLLSWIYECRYSRVYVGLFLSLIADWCDLYSKHSVSK